MKIKFIWRGLSILIIAFISASVYALPISSSDIWQDAIITGKSSQHSQGAMVGLFDGKEGGYGDETGNALFADSGLNEGLVHWVEWSTGSVTTLRSVNLIAYHDFDARDINHRGFSEFNLFYNDGNSWVQAYSWMYLDLNQDQHYGGGPSYSFAPDPHDMSRSYLELTANLSSQVIAQFFRAEYPKRK